MDSPLGVLTLPGEAAFEEKEAFLRLGYSIGGFMVWPSNKVDRRMAINGTRGFTVRIADRMDLTLECIRRHYRGETSPLAAALTRYEDFFALFEDFRCYVDFLPPAGPRRRRGTGPVLPPPLDDFAQPSVSADLAGYRDYECRTSDFIHARNARIAATQPPATSATCHRWGRSDRPSPSAPVASCRCRRGNPQSSVARDGIGTWVPDQSATVGVSVRGCESSR